MPPSAGFAKRDITAYVCGRANQGVYGGRRHPGQELPVTGKNLYNTATTGELQYQPGTTNQERASKPLTGNGGEKWHILTAPRTGVKWEN